MVAGSIYVASICDIELSIDSSKTIDFELLVPIDSAMASIIIGVINLKRFLIINNNVLL